MFLESTGGAKECIEGALIQPLEHKEMGKIPISGIVKRAGVSGTAFCSHYKTKEDVLKSALGDVIDRIVLLTPGHPSDEGYWLPLFTETKRYMKTSNHHLNSCVQCRFVKHFGQ